MDWSGDSLRLLVTVLPGFLSARVKAFFLPPKASPPFDQIVEGVSFAVVNYIVATSLFRFGWWPDWLGALSREGGRATLDSFYSLGLVSVATGLLAGLVVGNELHYRLARALRLTDRTGRSDVWQDCFSTFDDNWLEVELVDGRRVSGWAQYFSEHGSSPSLFLRSASWIDGGHLIPVEGEGILLTESARIRYVEFRGPDGGTNGYE